MLATSPRAISPVNAHIPSSPPASKERSQSITYPRAFLLSLARPNEDQTHPTVPLKISRRLSSFTPILRCSVALTDSDWGISEDQSSLFDNQPISRDLPIPSSGERHPCDRSRLGMSRGNSSDDGYGSGSGYGVPTRDSETLFSFRSMDDKEGKLPILVDFDNPFGTNENGQNLLSHVNDSDQEKEKVHKGIVNGKERERERERESIFPRSVNSSTTSLQNLGIRLGPREDLVDQNSLVGSGGKLSRSNSNSSITSSRSVLNRRSSSPFGGQNELNPFAPPFPLPNTINAHGNGQLVHPKPISLNEAIQRRISTSSDRSNPRSQSPEPLAVAGSLPLPKNLPSSLPAKPSPLPPVFVKRESAALPQPMALPDVAPLGKDWHGDNSLSGNEKRRRASLLHAGQTISRGSSPLSRVSGGGSAPSSRRGSMVSNNDEITIRARSPVTGDRLRELGMGMGRRNSHSNKNRW
ncbi:hypothetical protein V865_004414 [Kwoniella europaea PYCC6329]|uniref:Uncharacterized protein n=1 Tax=Kwoniella europaea PYCC6329 TaxID=1423913 RepID=A0AAX4KJT4_9TREE